MRNFTALVIRVGCFAKPEPEKKIGRNTMKFLTIAAAATLAFTAPLQAAELPEKA